MFGKWKALKLVSSGEFIKKKVYGKYILHTETKGEHKKIINLKA